MPIISLRMLNGDYGMVKIFTLIWAGIWQGFGLEVSFLMLWLGWHFIYSKFAHKIKPENIFHKIHDYIVN